jgi:hypothetical protein
MNIDQLREYKNWIGKSPVDVRTDVITAGGWASVFPMAMTYGTTIVGSPTIEPSSGFPLWASRVRNYFNVTPDTLELLPPGDAAAQFREIKNRLGIDPSIPTLLLFQKHAFALNGDVYVDGDGRPWFEMDKMGAVYHYRTVGPQSPEFKAAVASQTPYAKMPVFKLISPDGTGGSLELCVHNVNHTSTIGNVGVKVEIGSWVVKQQVYRGSYNYAETVVRGLPEHEYMDVKSHKEWGDFYVNPPLDSKIGRRRFPASARGKPIERLWSIQSD